MEQPFRHAAVTLPSRCRYPVTVILSEAKDPCMSDPTTEA